MPRQRASSCRLLLIALFFVCSAAVAASRDARGFESIPFGTPRADVLEQVCQRLKIDRIQGFSGIDYRGPGGLRLINEEEDIVIRGYRLDQLRTDAILIFNANGKFARVQYEAQKRPSGYFQTTIKDDVVALSRTFQKMFGSPTFQMQPRLSEMRPGSRNFYWRWTRGRDTVFTAIVADEEDFGAVGVIADDVLLREAPVRRPEPEPEPVADATPPADALESFTAAAQEPSPSPLPSATVDAVAPDAVPSVTPEGVPVASPPAPGTAAPSDPAFVPTPSEAPAVVPAPSAPAADVPGAP